MKTDIIEEIIYDLYTHLNTFPDATEISKTWKLNLTDPKLFNNVSHDLKILEDVGAVSCITLTPDNFINPSFLEISCLCHVDGVVDICAEMLEFLLKDF